MDFAKVLGRAWEITWRWKVLWILGFLASLGQGTPATTSSYSFSGDEFNYDRWGIYTPPEEIVAGIIGLIILICCIAVIIAIVIWVVSVIARGGLIAAVQQIEESGSTTFRRAWVAGRKKFWTLFGLGILAALPVIILVLLGLLILGTGIGLGVGLLEVEEAAGITTIVLVTICCGGLLCCGLFFLMIALDQIRIYGERAAILEDLGWIDAFGRGWQVLKENLGVTIVLWLIFFAIGIVIAGISMAIFVALVLPFIPILSIFEPGVWIIAPLCFGGILMVIVFGLIRSVVMTFTSATWTLAYRELTGWQASLAEAELVE